MAGPSNEPLVEVVLTSGQPAKGQEQPVSASTVGAARSPSRAAAWRACAVLAVVSVVAITLGVAIHFGRQQQQGAATGTQLTHAGPFYVTLSGPAGSFTEAPYPDHEVLPYPAPPLPDAACTCRLSKNNERFHAPCPSPWMNNFSQVPPALAIVNGSLVERDSGRPAALHGVNWFGWNAEQTNFDGLWAFQDWDIPDWGAVGNDGGNSMGFSWWGKRRMTNDFAAVVHRMKLLGFNAVRAQFIFERLIQDVDQDKVHYPCYNDDPTYIGLNKTLDPLLLDWLQKKQQAAASAPAETAALMSDELYAQLKEQLPAYTGMPHPPPATGNPQCDDKPWSAPYLPTYEGPLHVKGSGGNMSLTMCNYYLPAAPQVKGIHRFLWQIQNLISEGFYVLLDFNSERWYEPNMQYSQLLATNWGNLWRQLTDLPEYKQHMAGRVFPDFVNEASRWNCQWDSGSYRREQWKEGNQTITQWKPLCAPLTQSYGLTAAGLWKLDSELPIFINGAGQNRNWNKDTAGGNFESMSWGDGFITNNTVLKNTNISDPSQLLLTASTQMSGPGMVLAPHLYPPSITRNPPETPATNRKRWQLSWGLKMQGRDTTSQGKPLPKIPVVAGELGAYDKGDNSWQNADTTVYTSYDKEWLASTADFLQTLAASAGQRMSWFWWCWNANSRDTKGIVGPQNTFREVQWTKVRLLTRLFELRPWYCTPFPEFCEQVEY